MLTFLVCTLSHGVYAISSYVADKQSTYLEMVGNRQKNIVRLQSRPALEFEPRRFFFMKWFRLNDIYPKTNYGVCARHIWLGHTAKYINVNIVIMLESKSRIVFRDELIFEYDGVWAHLLRHGRTARYCDVNTV